VVAIMSGQEFQWVFTAKKLIGPGGGVHSGWGKTQRRIGVFYFYVLDPDAGPAFIQLCTYFPYPRKVWLNGHEWANAKPTRPTSATGRWATGSLPAKRPTPSRGSATGSGPATPKGSSTAGSP
jgi:hypothetical protein